MRNLWIVPWVLLTACSGSHGPGSDGGAAGYDECAMPTDCIVVPASCCGSCGAATRGDSVAVSRARSGEYRTSVCGDELGCPRCFMEQDPTLVATCEAGRCVVVDLQLHGATECADASECHVRAVECCECGATISPSTVIAISDPAAYEALVCDPGMGCAECAPIYPPEYEALCEAGRCVFRGSGP